MQSNLPSKFSDRVMRLLERVEYRCATTTSDKEAIFRLRHDAYMREGAIERQASGMFHDAFDEVANVWIVGMYIDGELASSVRLHVAHELHQPFPASTVFSDLIDPMLARRQVLVDPTRFVTKLEFSREFPEMPYLTIRPGWMAGDYFGADYILATIRSEHQAYYRRVFGHVTWADARVYPTLKKPIACMGLDFLKQRESVHARYPFYASTPAERAALFGVSSNPRGAMAPVTWDAELETA